MKWRGLLAPLIKQHIHSIKSITFDLISALFFPRSSLFPQMKNLFFAEEEQGSPRPFAFDFMKFNGGRFVDEYCFELRRQHQFHQLNEYKKAFRSSQLKLINGEVVDVVCVSAPVHEVKSSSSSSRLSRESCDVDLLVL